MSSKLEHIRSYISQIRISSRIGLFVYLIGVISISEAVIMVFLLPNLLPLGSSLLLVSFLDVLMLSIFCSAGILPCLTHFQRQATDPEQLINISDDALYIAKSKGRNWISATPLS